MLTARLKLISKLIFGSTTSINHKCLQRGYSLVTVMLKQLQKHSHTIALKSQDYIFHMKFFRQASHRMACRLHRRRRLALMLAFPSHYPELFLLQQHLHSNRMEVVQELCAF